jgi:hypothetical protein
MTPIEWMAIVLAVIVIVKMLVIVVKPKAWMGVINFFYGNPIVLMVVSLVLAAGSLWYLIGSGITIVQIFAVFFFLAFISMVSVSVYSREMIALAKKILKDRKFMSRAWVSIHVWRALSIWVLKELFF